MSDSEKSPLDKTIVLDEDALDETKTLDQLAELAGRLGNDDVAKTIVLDDGALDETESIEKLAELAAGTDDLDHEDS